MHVAHVAVEQELVFALEHAAVDLTAHDACRHVLAALVTLDVTLRLEPDRHVNTSVT